MKDNAKKLEYTCFFLDFGIPKEAKFDLGYSKIVMNRRS